MKTRVATLGIGGELALATMLLVSPTLAQQDAAPTSNRVALVIGEGAYRTGALPAAPNDAGLVAETLAGAGFDVTGARDLDGDGLRGAVRDFLAKAGATGPDGIALVYVAGRALQFDGDNYFEPIDAQLARPSDIPIETLRLGDLDRALAALPIQAKVVIVDGAYAGQPTDLGLPSGLALIEAEQGELLALSAAPGTVAPQASGPYGVYAQSLVQAMKQGGAPVEDVFDRLRLSVETATGGAEVPWDSNKLTRSFKFFDRSADAPLVESAQIPFSALQRRPLRDFPPDQAYDVAIARDTLPAYAEFLTAFPDSPLVRRIQLLQAVRRESLFWSAAVRGGTPSAFWTYLVRYRKGPHVVEARRRLSRLAAASLPPPSFSPLTFDVPPPPEPEIVVFERPLVFDAPDLPVPPRPPVFLLPPRVEPPPPPRPSGPGFLPIPVPVAIPSVRGFGEAGFITPPRVVRGAYPHPRPFVRGPNGDGLLVDDGVGEPGARQELAPTSGQPASLPGLRPHAPRAPLAGHVPPAVPIPPVGQALPAGQATSRPVPATAVTAPPGEKPLPTPGAAGRASGSVPPGKPAPNAGRVGVQPHGTARPATPDPLSATPAAVFSQPVPRSNTALPSPFGQPVPRPAAPHARPTGNAIRPPAAALRPSAARSNSSSIDGPRLIGTSAARPHSGAGLTPGTVPEHRPAPDILPLPESHPAPVPRAFTQPGSPHPVGGPAVGGIPANRRPACGYPGEPPCHP